MGIARIPGGGILGGGILAPKGAKDHFHGSVIILALHFVGQ